MEILSDEDIVWLLELKEIMKNENKDHKNIEENIKYKTEKIRERFKDFKFESEDKKSSLIDWILSSDGNYNNIIAQCPECNKNNVLELIGGDVYLRLFLAKEEKRVKEYNRIKNMPLFINISPCVGDYPYNFCCLNCGYEWK